MPSRIVSKSTSPGRLELKPGVYSLVVQGENVVFHDESRKSYTTPVKIENGSVKFKTTMVDYVSDKIRYIELGGSTTRLAFIE
jgi:hypothetical protein